MSERLLVGPFLTRAEAARRARLSRLDTAVRPDLLRIRSPWLEEAYFAFQFDRSGVRPGVGRVVQELKAGADDESIADWLVRPNPALGGTTPLAALAGRNGPARVIRAGRAAGPAPHAPQQVPPPVHTGRARPERRHRTARHPGIATG